MSVLECKQCGGDGGHYKNCPYNNETEDRRPIEHMLWELSKSVDAFLMWSIEHNIHNDLNNGEKDVLAKTVKDMNDIISACNDLQYKQA